MRSAVLCTLALVACSSTTSEIRVEPSFVQVVLDEGQDPGTEDAPLTFTTETLAYTFTVTTLDRAGDPYPFNGDLKIRVRPARLDMDAWVTLVDGTWTGPVSFYSAFGPTRVWFADEGDKDATSERAPSWSAGVSDALQFARPSIPDMQRTDDHETSPLVGEFVNPIIGDREVVVTALGGNGFWVTDLGVEVGDYSSLYIYTFSKPEVIGKTLEVGSRLAKLDGVVQEYLGTSQFAFPNYDVDEDAEPLTAPDPVAISEATACDNDLMEGLESALVRLEDAHIPDDFREGTDDYTEYIEYGQWPVTFGDGSCTIYASSSATIPSFDPTGYAGDDLGYVGGMLSEVWGKWILVLRGTEDIGIDLDESAAAGPPAQPRARARPTTASR